jgi:hypothetical protein
MNDSLAFCQWLFCWMLANYGTCNDPVCEQGGVWPKREAVWSGWSLCVLARSVCAALLWWAAASFTLASLRPAALLLIMSVLIPWLRRQFVPVRRLVEFELVVNGGAVLIAWVWIRGGIQSWATLQSFGLDRSRTGAICVAAALLIYMVRGGNHLVRGVLSKAGGLPDDNAPGSISSEGFAHGRMIGQVERIIVVLVVMLGNLQALAFFFAAKGLIRSKELENRRNADYFLLGSLASFLIALASGLILQHVFAALWK